MKQIKTFMAFFCMMALLCPFESCKTKNEEEYDRRAGAEMQYDEIKEETINSLKDIRVHSASLTTFEMAQRLNEVEERYEAAYQNLLRDTEDNVRRKERLRELYEPIASLTEYNDILSIMSRRNSEVLQSISDKYWINAANREPNSIFRIVNRNLGFVNFVNSFPLMMEDGLIESDGEKLFFELDGARLQVRNAQGKTATFVEATNKDWLMGTWEHGADSVVIRGAGGDSVKWENDGMEYSIEGSYITVTSNSSSSEFVYAYVNRITGETTQSLDYTTDISNYDYQMIEVPVESKSVSTFKMDISNDCLIPVELDGQHAADIYDAGNFTRRIEVGPQSVAWIFN